MNKFFLLMKIQLMSWFGINKAIHSKPQHSTPALQHETGGISLSNGNHKGILKLILAVVGMLYFLFVSYTYSQLVVMGLKAVGGDLSILLALMMMLTSVIILLTGIYSNGKTLFVYKDYDQVISLPVSVVTVVASRVALIYIYELMFALVLLVPAAVVYVQNVQVPFAFYPVYLIMILAVPLLPLIVGSFFGTIVAAIGSRAKRFSTAVNSVFSMLIVGAIVVFSTNMSGDEDQLVNAVSNLGSQVTKKYPPSAMFAKGVSELDILSIVTFIVISLVAFLAFCYLISIRYREICSRISAGSGGKRYKKADIKFKSTLLSLYKREIGRYFSSSIYVTNTAVGLVMAVVFCIVLVIPGGAEVILKSISVDESLYQLVGQIVPLLIASMVAMSCTTGSSISMEGKQLWILKSMPVPAKLIFASKIMVNLTLTIPASIICGVLLTIVLNLSGTSLVMVFAIPIIYALFSAVLGVIINLKLPKLDWQNDVQVVKQSAASMVSMLGTASIAIIILIAAVSVMKFANLIIWGTSLVLVVATILLALYLIKKGDDILRSL